MSRALGAAGAAFALTLMFSTGSARAQTEGFALSRFEPAERGSEWFVLDSLDLRGHLRWNAGVVADGAYLPLAIYNPNGELRTAVVRNQVFVHPGASLVLWDRVRFALSIPVVVYQDGEDGTINGVAYAAPETPAFGDIRLSGDVRLLGEHGDPATLAAGIALHLPTGSASNFTSDGSVRVEPHVLAAGDIAAFTWGAKLGLQYSGLNERVDGTPLGSEMNFAAAAGVRLVDRRLVIGPELFGATGLNGSDAFLKMKSSPLDVLLGAHWTFADQWRVGAGAGAGLTQGFGSPQARYMISIERVAPFEASKPPLDRDGDGVPDGADACPDTAGIETSDPKTNGCPPDRDHDGVFDAVDACPDTAGVETSDPKTNGCPPDPDRDQDKIPNERDACPDEAGKPNRDPKKNGCPLAFVAQSQIAILEQVKFVTDSAAILPGKDSQDVLNAVLGVITGHPEIKRLLVEGHTDNVGSAAHNKKLSQARADSVCAWLVKHGIAKDQLSAAGFGTERPIADNGTTDGRRANRRVEFHIVESETAPAL